MSNPFAAYGAGLAAIALQAAKAAGDTLIAQVGENVVARIPDASTAAINDFLDVVPASYREVVGALLKPELLAAATAADAGVVDRIHTGVAIAQAALDTRIGALSVTISTAAAEKATEGTVLAPFVERSGQAGG